jgi:hypothetical protein
MNYKIFYNPSCIFYNPSCLTIDIINDNISSSEGVAKEEI